MDAQKLTLEQALQLMFTSYPEVVTVQQMQKMLNIPRVNCYELISSNKIPGIIMGKGYRIPKIYIIRYLLNADGGKAS